MVSSPTPPAAVLDRERLTELRATGLLDAGAQPALERFTRLASALVDAPIALVSLVDADRQYFPAIEGLTGWAADGRQTPLSHSLCQHVVAGGTLVVPDARADPVLRENLSVTEMGVRAYLGAPLVSLTGRRFGSLCAIDETPRTWTAREQGIIEDLAAAASTDLQLRTALTAAARQPDHDTLTGLANRRRLDFDLEAATTPGGAPAVLALVDHEGLQAYGDTFGHEAGDRLLKRIAGRLGALAQVAGGRAYRLGSDGFCVLAPAGTDVGAIASGTSERTGPIDVTARFGSVVLGIDAHSPAEALRLADDRLHAPRRRRTEASAEEASERLVQAFTARDASMGDRVRATIAHAEATARRLEPEAGDVAEIRLTARLHDVGMAAVPDRILTLPSRLDPDDWEFVRQHTLVGELIVAATPALQGVAAAVRSSHERWDGAGYPDGLSGSAIPLAARVVFVCAAFAAMTRERPYARARGQDEAVAELRRGAGAQFDAAVVEAFATATGPGSTP